MTPHLPEHPSDLTREQRRYLAQLRDFIATPPTLGGVYRRKAPAILLSVLGFGGAIAAAAGAGVWWAACAVAGAFVGVRVREYGVCTWAVTVWPATAQAIDRLKLAGLLADDHPDPAPPPGRSDLTSTQRGYLADLRRFRTTPPRILVILARRLAGLAVPMGVMLGVLIGSRYLDMSGLGWVGAVGLGLGAGAAIRDAADVWRAKRVWPATAAVADWRRIDDLVGEPAERP